MILPKFIRKLLAILRGSVSPVIIFLSIILGFCFGLIPGWSGLHTVILIVVMILNIHTGLFILSGALAKSLCFAAAPVLYHTGVWIQAHLSFLLSLLESIPLIGITDYNRYSIAGAIVLGPIIGAIAGLLMARSVIAFRRQLLKLEEGSEKFSKWYSNRWVRIMDRLLIGKRTKDTKSLFTAKTKYIRKAGVALAAIVLIASIIVTHLIKDSTIKDYATKQMTKANGAEVNLDKLNLSMLSGSVSASGLQVTDPEKPEKNQVSIENVSANASLYNLLLGKLVMEHVELSNIKFDQQRSSRGATAPESDTEKKPAVFDPRDFKLEDIDLAKLDTYLKDAKALKEKLQKLSKWLPKADEKETVEQVNQIPQKYLDYLKVRANVPASPRILAKETILDKVQLSWSMFGNSKIFLTNLSDSPKTAKLPITFEMTSHDTPAAIKATIDFSLKEIPKLSGTFNGLDLAKIQSGLSNDAGLVFESGLASGNFSGTATNESIDLTVDISISNLAAKGQGKGVLGLGSDTTSQAFDALKELKTTIRVVGPVSEPRLVFDVKGLTEEFKNALVQAGKDRLAKEIDSKLGEEIDEKLGDEVPEEVKDALKKPDELIKGLGGLLGGKKDDKK